MFCLLNQFVLFTNQEPLMTASTLKHDHDIIIRKSAESLKLFWYEEVAVEADIQKCS